MKYFAIFLLLITSSTGVFSQIRLPRLISDGAVLQRDRDLTLWGWAGKGEVVTLTFRGEKFDAITGDDGKWKIQLPRQAAGGPFTMKFAASNEVEVKDILFGDVWLCSGQSNMELTMERVKEKYRDEIARSENPNIRQFLIPDQYDFNVQHEDVSDGKWVSASPLTLTGFSAVAYFFARDVYAQFRVPVGLINAALGGSPIEAWMSEDALKPFPEAYAELQKFKDHNIIREIEEADRKRSQEWYRDLNASDSGVVQRPRWYDTSMVVNNWDVMKVPGNFPTKENGSIWFRKQIELSPSFTNNPVKLRLGRMIDQDSVFVNGRFVGTTGYQYPPRRYDVAPGIFRAGENTITIRLINSSGLGGFDTGKRYFVATDTDTVDLAGEWQYRRGTTMPALQGPTFVRWKPAGLYNRMISPLTSYGIKGTLWYQGESNAREPRVYQKLLPALIADWRGRWGYEFPFLFVQLPNFVTGSKRFDWPEMRYAQSQALSVPATGMVVAIDAGEWNDIHPLNKEIIGERLALVARKVAYGQTGLMATSPVPLKAIVKGKSIEVTFDQEIGASRAGKGGLVNNVEVSDDGVVFTPVDAHVKGRKLIIMVKDGSIPKFVYYAWMDSPESEINLYNKARLPVSPFRIEIRR